MNGLMHSNLSSLKLLHQGKVRDIYDINEEKMLIVTTDRLSAFDVIMNQPIPFKGEVLTKMANFWFDNTNDIIKKFNRLCFCFSDFFIKYFCYKLLF